MYLPERIYDCVLQNDVTNFHFTHSSYIIEMLLMDVIKN